MPETLPPPGDQVARLQRRMDAQDRKIATLETALRARWTTISGPPGIVLKDGAGVHVDPGGQVGSTNFVSGVSGWRADHDLLEINDLKLRGGIIGNDDLANPVSARGAGASVVNFPVTTSETVIGTASIPVPAGFSQAIVMCVVHCAAFNGNVDYDYLGVRAGIQGSGGGGTQAIAGGSGGWASASASAQRLISGLDGGSISVDVRAWSTSNPWVANASNAAHIDAVATFLR